MECDKKSQTVHFIDRRKTAIGVELRNFGEDLSEHQIDFIRKTVKRSNEGKTEHNI